jgi:hypothetical protein
MTNLVADKAMLAVLSQVNELTEIRDANGTVVGFFAPAGGEHARAAFQVAARAYTAELERRLATEHDQGLTTREVFEHLLTLTPDAPMQAYLRQKIEQLAERERCPIP